jgi:hypothetical protein
VSPRLRAEGDCYRERNNDAECGARPDQQGCLPETHDHRPTAMLRPERDIVSANGSDLQGWQLVGFTPDKMVLRFFKWNFKTQSVEQTDTLAVPRGGVGAAGVSDAATRLPRRARQSKKAPASLPGL